MNKVIHYRVKAGNTLLNIVWNPDNNNKGVK